MVEKYYKCLHCGTFKLIKRGQRASRFCGRKCRENAYRKRRREKLQPLVPRHGLSRHPLYETWRSMRERCNKPDRPRYDRYGGRGIKVCERWDMSFPNFLADIEKLGPKPSPQHTLDRRDDDGDYEPGNVRWASPAEQNFNRITRTPKSGYVGVTYSPMYVKKFRARWKYERKEYEVGRFDTPEEAHAAREKFIADFFAARGEVRHV